MFFSSDADSLPPARRVSEEGTCRMICIRTAIALPVNGLYTYRVPSALQSAVSPGKRVLVPFGNRRVTGYVIEEGVQPDKKLELRDILEVMDDLPLFQPTQIPFFKWIAEYYLHPLGEVIKTALPRGLSPAEVTLYRITETGRALLAAGTAGSGNGLLEKLNRHRHPVPASRLSCNRRLLTVLAAEGCIEAQTRMTGRGAGVYREKWILPGTLSIPEDRFQPMRKTIVDAVCRNGGVSERKLRKAVPGCSGYLGFLVERGSLLRIEKEVYRDPFGESIRPDTPKSPSTEQAGVIDTVSEVFDKGFSAFLLKGVTGSGKTEVYLQLTAACVARGGKAIVLVPEIALISQMEKRFRARFGDDIAILHSRLSKGERFDQWQRIVRGDVSIAIGARSALFAPFTKVSLIVVDEEHDASYKQESGLRYNARDLAVVRGRMEGGIVLLGSATPSIQSTFNTLNQKFRLLELTRRIHQRPLPDITLVDLREWRNERGIRRYITTPLKSALETTLARGEQALLFLNRRGFANHPVCGACGEAITCRNCDIALTLHRGSRAYLCHYCGFSLPATAACPHCAGKDIRLLGMGTEKLEQAIGHLFPSARIARMDRDTTARKGAVMRILKEVKERKVDILIGTQMIAKGHDFPHITLVGIICADLSLSFPDFRAGERTFQLLAQVAGRAGRGEQPGRVILQTYSPDHYSIQCARHQAADRFYDSEIPFRRELRYPPFSRMAQLKVSGADRDETMEHAAATGEVCRRLLSTAPDLQKGIELLGPVEAPLARIAQRYRWQLLLKGRDSLVLHRFLHRLQDDRTAVFRHAHVKVVVDVDPYMMM
jgi:primosomal protein N' (replication factor Y)